MRLTRKIISGILSMSLSVTLMAGIPFNVSGNGIKAKAESTAQARTIPVLETDVMAASDECTMLGVYGSYYSQAQDALDRVNEIRREACEAGNVPYPGNPSRMLSPSDYVPIKWSKDLESIARIRAMEGGLAYSFLPSGHSRLNKKEIWSVQYNGVQSYAENLAYNWGNSMVSGINQWYDEKDDWVNQTTGAVTGHYTSMINPKYTYIGLGDFYTEAARFPNTLAGAFCSSTETLDQSMQAAQTDIMQKIEVHNSYINEYVLEGNNTIDTGDTAELELRVNLKNGSGKLKLWVLGELTYTSSDDSVAQVSDSGIVTGINPGTATITAKSGNTVLTSTTVTVNTTETPVPEITPSPTPVVTEKPEETPSPSPEVTQKPEEVLTPSPEATQKPATVVSPSPKATQTAPGTSSAKPSQTPEGTNNGGSGSQPTTKPSQTPEAVTTPSVKPSQTPTIKPSSSVVPSQTPTIKPSSSVVPSQTPTIKPSPSARPSQTPTIKPSPSVRPSQKPTIKPSPSVKPSQKPTINPSPSVKPTVTPAATEEPVQTSVPPIAEEPENPDKGYEKPSGINVAYHTQEEIRNYAKNSNVSLEEKLTFAEEPVTKSPYSLGKLSDKTLQSALKMLNQVRYIAGIQDNVELSEKYNKLCQAGALANYANNDLSHFPEQPGGMSDDMYQLATQGAGSSNIAWTSWSKCSLNYTIVSSWMEDGDPGNIESIGHRRWLINPEMGKTGFGAASGKNGTYSCVYAFDHSNIPAMEYGVAWPAQNMPLEYFGSYFPWSVSMGYDLDEDNINVTLVRKNDGKTWRFSNASKNTFYVNNEGYGQPGCIIFRPDNITYNAGDIFKVEITGLDTPVSYTVNFFELYKSANKDNNNKDNNIKNGTKITDNSSNAIYKITGTGKDKTVTYVKSTKKNPAYITIPDTININGSKYKVTSIGNEAFKDNKKLKSVQIGKNIINIGQKAFWGCKKLDDITVYTNKLTSKSVGKKAFSKGNSKPKIKADKSKWKLYKNIFKSKGMSKKCKFKTL